MTNLFRPEVLDRCIVSDEERARFKATVQRREMIDEDQLWKLVCYVRADGHVLVDEMIRL